MDIDTLRTLYKEKILDAARRNKLDSVRVFGSTVRGDASENSDVDILVHCNKNTSLMDLGGFSSEMEALLGVHVDVVTDTSLHWYIRDRVLQEAVIL